MSNLRVIRLSPNGDDVQGLSDWENIPAHRVLAGKEAKVRRHKFFGGDRSGGQVRVGVSEATAYSEKIDNYPKDEFMHVIEGSVTIIHHDGREETFVAGDSFFMPSGFNGVWKQTETIKKYFMVFDASVGTE
ncbi:cupin domain-containing protein [Mesorhizobium sp. M1312]|uniref:cupin domain-containing protein n=1 Tax=unclassified Mesorhizobium TaxID=325217 RepID=UPI003335BF27